MLSVSAQSAQLSNAVKINFVPVVALGHPIFHLLNMVCLYINCGPVVALGRLIVYLLHMMY